MNSVNCHRLLICVPAALLWCSLAAAEVAKTADALEAEIRGLQKERITTLQRLVEISTDQYSQGRVDFTPVLVAHIELLDAELDGAETLAERIELVSNQLTSAKKAVKMAEDRVRFGAATAGDVFQAKSALIRIRISLLKLHLAQQKEGAHKH